MPSTTRPIIRGLQRCWLLSLALMCGCTKYQMLDATIPREGSTRLADVPYGPLAAQRLDVYRPRDAKPGAAIVVFFHGGDWQRGDKAGYRFVAQALTSRGFIAVLPNYRLYPSVVFPAFVEDAALAVKWTHDHAAEIGGDPSQLFLMGHSAGAHLVALITLDPQYLRAVSMEVSAIRGAALLSGPLDFMPPPDDRGAFSMMRDDTKPDPSIEPIHFARADAPPLLMIHGLDDTTVSPDNSRHLFQQINADGGRARLILYPGVDHVGVVLSLAWPFRWIAPTLDDVTRFFRALEP